MFKAIFAHSDPCYINSDSCNFIFLKYTTISRKALKIFLSLMSMVACGGLC